jgi:hypothetical protein
VGGYAAVDGVARARESLSPLGRMLPRQTPHTDRKRTEDPLAAPRAARHLELPVSVPVQFSRRFKAGASVSTVQSVVLVYSVCLRGSRLES